MIPTTQLASSSTRTRARRVPGVLAALGVLAVTQSIGGCSTPEGTPWTTTWSPMERHFDPYVADPRRARFGISAVRTDSDLAEAGEDRVTLELGGRLDVARIHPVGAPDGGTQFDLDAGFVGDFDREASLDNLGWSGIYALHASWRLGRTLALRFGFAHESSHLGDEYVEETGRQRINYTRDELRLGARWDGLWPVRLYAEYGHGIHTGSSLQERGRAQAGLEWSSAAVRAGTPGWYGALDLATFEESDWDPTAALEWGWAVPVSHGRGTWRFGALFYDGRSAIGELFQDDETRAAFGIKYDL